MNKWKPAKLGDIAEMCLGKMLDKEKNKGVLQPYIANVNLRWGGFDLTNLSTMRFEESESERYGLKSGDLVVCEGGEPGRCAIWRGEIPEMKIQKAIHRVRTNKNYSNEFLFYRFLLAGRNGELKKHFIGSTIKHLTGSSLKQVEFDFPSLTEQNRIAAVLTALDAKIELNQRINAELEGMAKLLYDYWFVQFDFPMTSAQAAALGKPNLTGHPYRASGGKMIYNETLKRDIPEGWTDGSLLDVATFTNGIACQKYPADGGETLRVIKIKDMRTGLTAESDIVTANVPSKVKIKNGDILFSWSASLEVMIWAGGEGALNQHIFKVTSDTHPRSFCYFVLLDYLRHFRMMADLRKTTMGHITIDHLEQSQIAIPDDAVAEAFEVLTKPIINRMVKAHEENQELTQLRDWLLPMLMNGQVTVG